MTTRNYSPNPLWDAPAPAPARDLDTTIALLQYTRAELQAITAELRRRLERKRIRRARERFRASILAHAHTCPECGEPLRHETLVRADDVEDGGTEQDVWTCRDCEVFVTA